MLNPKQNINALHAYTPGKSKEEAAKEFGILTWVKLASNENPFGSPVSIQDLEPALKSAALYPDQATHSLKQDIATKNAVPVNSIVLGNGSDDILQMLALSYLGEGDELLTSECTFSVYAHVAHLVGARVLTTPLKHDAYDLEAMESALTSKTKMVMIANPNNPTGTSKNEHELRGFLDVLPDSCCCVIDEAYIEFSSEPSMLKLLDEYPNVVITRTFSKLYGLAAFRIGYGIMHPEVAQVLEKVRQPFNVNSLALEAAKIALNSDSFIQQTLENNVEQMTWVRNELSNFPCEVVPSDANFICIRFEKDAGSIVQGLLERGVIVRHLKSFGLPNAIRVTIGKPDENETFINALKESL